MFCPNCGSQNPDHSTFCSNCGSPLIAQQTVQQPIQTAQPVTPPPADFKDYQTMNIILLVVSLLCCGSIFSLATSIAGLVFSSQARTAFGSGNYAEAQNKAKTAKTLAIVSIVLIVLTAVLVGILLLIYGISAFAIIAESMGSY